LEAVAACLKFFMGLALVHFQKYWLLSGFENLSGLYDLNRHDNITSTASLASKSQKLLAG
jgi:hypothetical protein